MATSTTPKASHTFTDLRQFVDFLDEHDELVAVEGVDWDLELGGITRLAIENRPAPAILFDDILDHEPGYRVLTNALTTPFQWSAATGVPVTRDKRELIVSTKNHSIEDTYEPVTTASGPVLENVQRDDGVDVEAFPTPRWNENDGGRYIGTGDFVLTRNADTGDLNAGTYRVQVQGSDELTVWISPGKDGRLNRDSYHERGEPFPIAVSVGHAPDLFIGSIQRLPAEVNELEYVGGLRGEPVETVEGEVTGLPIPANAEIVFEGHIYPDSEPVPEGPFGEWTGYYAGGTHAENEQHELIPMTVERVYHRDDPIILGVQLLPPPAQVKSEVRHAARLWNELDQSGIPGIQAVNSFTFGPNGWFTVIAIDQQYGGHSTQVGHHAATGPAGAYQGRFTVVVDDDVDAFDQDEVMWALCSRTDPAEDIQIMTECWSTPLDPVIHPDRKNQGDTTNTRAIVDATRPYHWRDRFPKVNTMSDERAERIRKNWTELFGEDGSLT